ncbi:MAG: hypothetical protein J6S81_07445, partial [Treponema sp.]|nr:hypothetical protein [Treponema sp.]
RAYWHGATLHPACCLQNKCVWKQTEISFVRSGKRNMAENPFANKCAQKQAEERIGMARLCILLAVYKISVYGSKRKSVLCVAGSEICLKIHLRGANEVSPIPITSHHGFSDRFCW